MRPIMTQEDKDKELLLKDLCARLPYGVKIEVVEDDDFSSVEDLDCYYLDRVNNKFYKIKPYLFPLSSMTEEQMEELEELCDMYTPGGDYDPIVYRGISILYKHINDSKYKVDFETNVIDWFHKNHIDYRGLIPMGLANDATGLNLY